MNRMSAAVSARDVIVQGRKSYPADRSHIVKLFVPQGDHADAFSMAFLGTAAELEVLALRILEEAERLHD